MCDQLNRTEDTSHALNWKRRCRSPRMYRIASVCGMRAAEDYISARFCNIARASQGRPKGKCTPASWIASHFRIAASGHDSMEIERAIK
jgi:hypothetical protein